MAKYEYTTRPLSSRSGGDDGLFGLAKEGWRLIAVMDHTPVGPGRMIWEREVLDLPITVPDTPDLHEAVAKIALGSVKFDPFVRAQAEGDPLPGEAPSKPAVLGSYIPHGLETALIELLEQHEKRKEGIASYVPSGIDTDLTNLLSALRNDTWILLTCEEPVFVNGVSDVAVEIENLNSDMFLAPRTTVSSVLNAELAKVENAAAPPWHAGWGYIGQAPECVINGSYAHCANELREALAGRDDKDAEALLQRFMADPAKTWVGTGAHTIAWIKPL